MVRLSLPIHFQSTQEMSFSRDFSRSRATMTMNPSILPHALIAVAGREDGNPLAMYPVLKESRKEFQEVTLQRNT